MSADLIEDAIDCLRGEGWDNEADAVNGLVTEISRLRAQVENCHAAKNLHARRSEKLQEQLTAKDALNNDLMANFNQLRDRCWKAESELARWQQMYQAICADTNHKRRCARCGEFKTFSEFSKDATQSTGHGRYCLVCKREYSLDLSHKNETCRPYREAHDSTLFLGVHIAETVLQNYFDGIVKMPMHNPGYDFICGKGFKIDVKSSCRRSNPAENGSDYWRFHTDKNVTADYFLCLAFDNRTSLTPEHVWLIPSSVPVTRTSIVIVESKLIKWAEYEKDIEKAKKICNDLKRGIGNGSP